MKKQKVSMMFYNLILWRIIWRRSEMLGAITGDIVGSIYERHDIAGYTGTESVKHC